jgi:2-oxoglutarate ferredoxin oxidoreductase subunit beta
VSGGAEDMGAEERRGRGTGRQGDGGTGRQGDRERGSRGAEGQRSGGAEGREMEDELAGVPTREEIERHPMDDLLRTERLPHIWCPGCGLGTALSCFTSALMRSRLDLDKVSIVSGIGCTGRVAGYLRLDGFHTTHGRAIPFATGLKLANDDLQVIVFSGDGDLIAIGGNHFIHAARRNMDLTVICVNNFNYGMTGGQVGPTTPTEARTSTSPRGNLDRPLNVPNLAAAAGATYVARWTVLHARRLERSIYRALLKPGFSVVEIISPCPTLFVRFNRARYGTDMMEYYHEKAVIRHDAKPWEVDIELAGEIVCGEFVDIERPTYQARLREMFGELRPSEDLGLLHRPPVELDVPFEVGVARAELPVPSLETAAVRLEAPVSKAGCAERAGGTLEVRLCGFGGQGIILAGKITGAAAALYDDREVTLTQSYGPESRGGACSTALVISDDPILYPHVTRPCVMVAMSQEAYTTYHAQLAEGGVLLIDVDLVEPDLAADQRVIPIPATRIAEHELGRRIVANIVMLGALAALTEVASEEAMRKAVVDSVPKGTEELNMKAFQMGYEYARGLVGG